jgi:microcystin-dependent protein
MPSGAIVMWSGSAGTVPAGWNICDGANGTPNLVGRFIKGSTASGATGGSSTHSHSHSLSGGAHTLTTAEIPSHNHTFNIYDSNYIDTTNYPFAGRYNNQGTGSSTTHSTGGGGSHSHPVSGSIASGSNEPSYYELCYIMKA